MVNASRYPRTAAYLARLPQGLESYPDCEVKTDAHDGLRDLLAPVGDDESLPALVRDFIRGDYKETWLPEVIGCTVVHLLADLNFDSDEAYYQWAYDNNRTLFRKPHYRILMWVLSPTLLVNNGAKRWKALHRGTEVIAAPVSRDGDTMCAVLELTHPPRLFDTLDMLNIRSGVQAALDASNAPNAEVVGRGVSDTTMTFAARWGA